MVDASSLPAISVVVAASNAARSIAACLTALHSQASEVQAEVIVPDASTDGTSEIIAQQFPWVRHLRYPPALLIPHLWREGIQHSRGEIVAVTTAHCIPEAGWLAGMLKAHASEHAAVGGAIENATPATLVDWAIYFCRYSAYMLPFEVAEVAELPGDNASYKRRVLTAYPELMQQGFWEPAFHARMRADGFTLLMHPSIIVRHTKSYSLVGFLRQRWQHGRVFAAMRLAHTGVGPRLVRIMAVPAVPLVMAKRIAGRVLQKRRHLPQLLLSFPLVWLFLGAWSLGELAGYLHPQQTLK